MDKRKSLIILINNSFFLQQSQKDQLHKKVPSLTNEQVELLGKFLALEKRKSIESNRKIDMFQIPDDF